MRVLHISQNIIRRKSSIIYVFVMTRVRVERRRGLCVWLTHTSEKKNVSWSSVNTRPNKQL